jgi:hypothetical protein
MMFFKIQAGVVELADTQVSEACGRKALGVQVPPSAPNSMFGTSFSSCFKAGMFSKID